MAKRALGRGLGSLIPEGPRERTPRTRTTDNNEIAISQIQSNANQPRKFFDEEELQGLADSILSVGIIEPLILRPMGDKYEIVAGERRWRAAKIAGLTKVPAIVRNLTDEQVRETALIENIQREDLNPIEEAQAIKELIDKHNLKQEDLAKRLGKSRSALTNSLRLLKLPDVVQDHLIRNNLTAGHARALLMIKSRTLMGNLALKAVNEGLSVRALEQLANEKSRDESGKVPKRDSGKQPEIVALESRLEEVLGTRVSIKHGKNGGKIEIAYYDADDLERIMETIGTQ